MALTQDQLDQIEFQTAQAAVYSSNENKIRRLEAVRIAKEVLLENARSKPVDSRDVSASDITNFAESITQYVNQ